ncbi:hypothetical protein QBC47DRAFT_122184 [Echria macrotheca]|uniref:Uncharacterized protein n=1 Tax=Echria macrotheca TaxID=438768 RepID=A0AAJ0F4D1_9PEZI|nr:hypothetical protein QBC47DRAFT_122184 [Echria macrotheca]
MALPPIVVATLQSAVIAAFSNVIAQVITAHNEQKPLWDLDATPILHFFVYALLSTPPNFLWQELLESTFPAYHASPTAEAVASASAGDEKALDAEAEEGRLVEPRLNRANTLVKTFLDQTVGAAVNTLMFSVFMHGVRVVTATTGTAGNGMGMGMGDAWEVVWERTRGEFWDILMAGWRFWPFVSVVNFVFLTSVEARNLVGSLAGLGWGVYMSMFAGK